MLSNWIPFVANPTLSPMVILPSLETPSMIILLLFDLNVVVSVLNPPINPVDAVIEPLTFKLVPSNDKLGFDVPPSLNVPSCKLNSLPSLVFRLFDTILPVWMLSPDIFVPTVAPNSDTLM